MHYWLLKSEATCYSIDDLKRDKKTAWTGIRNYQARNFMRDQMQVGDLCLFYHSSADPAEVVGVCEVVRTSHPDETAQDKKDEHFDPKATKENPIWVCVDVAFKEKFSTPISLGRIKIDPKLSGIALAKQRSRLSIQPVSKNHFEHIVKMGSEKREK